MKEFHPSYLPPIFLHLAEKHSSVPLLESYLHTHASCKECFSECPYISPFITPLYIHISTTLSKVSLMKLSLHSSSSISDEFAPVSETTEFRSANEELRQFSQDKQSLKEINTINSWEKCHMKVNISICSVT